MFNTPWLIHTFGAAALAVATMLLVSPTRALAEGTATAPTTRTAKVLITLAGDSTVTEKAGWGIGFKNHVTPDVQVINTSAGGRSSRSFRAEGLWKKTLDTKADYVLIQFGHNDEPGKGPERETDPATTYTEFMSQYVDEARAAGMKPILVTSIARRKFDEAGKPKPSLVPYADAVRKIAAEKKVPLIDMNALTMAYYEKHGEEGCKKISPVDDKGVVDTTHLNAKGSEALGQIVTEELAKVVPELAQYIK